MTERTILLDALIRVAILFITAVLLPAAKAWIERNRDNRELQLVLTLASVAVKSVEGDLKTEAGKAKKAEAVSRLAEAVGSWGLKGFTTQELNHYIETAWKEMQAEDPMPLALFGGEPCPVPTGPEGSE